MYSLIAEINIWPEQFETQKIQALTRRQKVFAIFFCSRIEDFLNLENDEYNNYTK